jgi:hypothetical protein
VEVQLACRLLFVDLEGLNDGRATKTIIPKVAPRKLVSLAECVGDRRPILNAFPIKDDCARRTRRDGRFA